MDIFDRRKFLFAMPSGVVLATGATANSASRVRSQSDCNPIASGEKSLIAWDQNNYLTKLVLLGTGGGPVLGQTRQMTSYAMVSNSATYVVDCGMTVSNRLAQAGIPLKSIEGIFITHHHPDHNAEYGPLMLMAWVNGRYEEINSYGPPPLREITDYYLKSAKPTVDMWIDDLKVPPFPRINVQEISGPDLVMANENVRVSAAVVQHPPIVPALGYRFDFKDRSIAFSGDTVATDAMIKLAKGADILVHEAMYPSALDGMIDEFMGKKISAETRGHIIDHMMRAHTPVDEVGKIAESAGVKTLVLAHLVPPGDRPEIVPSELLTLAKKYFSGQVIVGHDLQVI